MFQFQSGEQRRQSKLRVSINLRVFWTIGNFSWWIISICDRDGKVFFFSFLLSPILKIREKLMLKSICDLISDRVFCCRFYSFAEEVDNSIRTTINGKIMWLEHRVYKLLFVDIFQFLICLRVGRTFSNSGRVKV